MIKENVKRSMAKTGTGIWKLVLICLSLMFGKVEERRLIVLFLTLKKRKEKKVLY